jgi:hypothetical protein
MRQVLELHCSGPLESVFSVARKALRKMEKFAGRFRERCLLFWVPTLVR